MREFYFRTCADYATYLQLPLSHLHVRALCNLYTRLSNTAILANRQCYCERWGTAHLEYQARKGCTVATGTTVGFAGIRIDVWRVMSWWVLVDQWIVDVDSSACAPRKLTQQPDSAQEADATPGAAAEEPTVRHTSSYHHRVLVKMPLRLD